MVNRLGLSLLKSFVILTISCDLPKLLHLVLSKLVSSDSTLQELHFSKRWQIIVNITICAYVWRVIGSQSNAIIDTVHGRIRRISILSFFDARILGIATFNW